MLIDTHCHLMPLSSTPTGISGGPPRASVAFWCRAVDFDAVAASRGSCPDCRHAFGIHPMYVSQPGRTISIACAKGWPKARRWRYGDRGQTVSVPDGDLPLQMRYSRGAAQALRGNSSCR